MFFSLSLRKSFIAAGIAAVLFSALYGTVLLKEANYGSTPYFYTVAVAPRYALESALAELRRMSGNLAAAVGLTGTSYARDDGRTAHGIPVLTYHRILPNDDTNNVTVANFRDQMETLVRAGWESVTAEEYLAFMQGEIELPERSFLLTFDDGAKDSFYPVDPILRSLDLEAVNYIIAHSAQTEESTYYMTPEEIAAMLRTGRWEIGSHSYDGHRPYPTDAEGTEGLFFSDRLWIAEENRLETREEFTERVRADLTRAREELERTYGVTIDTYAFPLGNEVGVDGVSNFPGGTEITAEEASKLYSVGFLQANGQQFTFNYPEFRTFEAMRIHVDHDWDGDRLLSIMENGLPKDLPFEDDFETPKGWLLSWGTMEAGRNNLLLSASDDRTSASAILDGSRLWTDYSFDASMNWTGGSVFLLADAQDSKTYDACAFSEGEVSIQRTEDGVTTTLAKRQDARITRGTGVTAGIRVHGAVIECTWGFENVLETYDRSAEKGGIGIQTWDETPGAATLQVSSVLVRPIE